MSESENSQDSGTQPVDVEMEEDHDLTHERSSEHFKEDGNAHFKNKQYEEAVTCYSQAISLCPTCAAYYGNRSAAYIMLNKYREALIDARHALSLDNTFIKAYLREGKCLMALGDPTHAIRSYTQVLELDPNNSIAKTELKSAKALHDFEQKALLEGAKGDYRTMLYCIDQCLNFSPHCFKYKTQRAECLALLGRYQEAQELANDILQRDRINPDAIYVRGICLYYQDNPEKAFNHFQEVLRLAPDHFKARETYRKAKYLLQTKQEGNTAFKEGRYKEAYEIYSKALEIDPHNRSTNSKLYCNRATVASKLGKLEESVQDCTKAVELDSTYVKAFMRRAKSYMDLEQYEEAVRDYETVHKLEKTRDTKRLLQEAKLELKKSKRKDYYKILGVTKHASEDEIKKAYKKRALIHHPDRHSHDTPEKQKEEEKKFKELGEAYGVLSDAKKRSRYDSGQDLEDLDGGFSDHIDPNQIFQAFFGGGGAGFPGHGYPGAGYSSGGGGGFPPGFSFHFG